MCVSDEPYGLRGVLAEEWPGGHAGDDRGCIFKEGRWPVPPVKKESNGDWLKNTLWYSVERIGLPTVLLFVMLWFFGRPLLTTYQGALESQTLLAKQCVESLVAIEMIVKTDAAENKVGLVREIRDVVCETGRSLADHEASQTKQNAQIATALTVMTAVLQDMQETPREDL